MKKKLTTVKFTASPEKAAMLDEAIERFRGQGGCLMPIMQEAQEIYGYLPVEVQTHIAEKLNKFCRSKKPFRRIDAAFARNPDISFNCDRSPW